MAKKVVGSYGGTAALPNKVTVYSDGSTSTSSSSSSSTKSSASSKSSGGSSKALADMTVAEAAAAGKSAEYNQLVSGYFSGGVSKPDITSDGRTYSQIAQNIPVANLAGTTPTPITVPTPEPSPYTQIVPIATVTPETKTLEGVQDEATKTLNDYIASLQENEADQLSYEAEYAKAERAAGIKEKQELVNQYTLQQNQIIAQQQADILAARNQSSVEGGTAGILSAREDAINRSAAIKILPVQAQLAAAQGNLEMAQERMNTMFDLKMKDAERKYNYNNKLLEATYGFMTEQQKQKADAIKIENDNAFTLKRDTINYLRDSVITAYKEGNSGLAAALSRIDEDSTNIDSEIANAFKNYGGGTGGNAEIDRVIDINGVPTAVDKYGNVITIKGGTQTTDTDKVQKSLDQFSFLKTTIKGAEDLAYAASPSAIAEFFRKGFDTATPTIQLQKKLDTLKVNLLTLNTDPAVKKYFGPQMTERDTELMTSAGTTMDAYSNSPADLKDELGRYDNLISRMETSVKNGISSNSQIITPDQPQSFTDGVNEYTLGSDGLYYIK